MKNTKERWWALFLFGFCTGINAMCWIQMSPIFKLIEDMYGVTTLVVNLMSDSFFIFFLFLNFPAVNFIDKYGLRWGTIFNMFFTTLGCWLRCLINVNFNFCMIGQFIIAASTPWIINSPTLVTTNWFKEKERPIATMIGTMTNVSGIVVGFLLPMLFITEYDGI